MKTYWIVKSSLAPATGADLKSGQVYSSVKSVVSTHNGHVEASRTAHELQDAARAGGDWNTIYSIVDAATGKTMSTSQYQRATNNRRRVVRN